MSSIAIKVFRINTDKYGFEELASITKKTSNLVFENVILDFSFCDFFEANMVAALQTVVSGIWGNLNSLEIHNLASSVQNILQKNSFLAQFGFELKPDFNHTTIPFKVFKLNAGEQFADYLDNHMNDKGIPSMTDALTKKFRQSLFEVFQNAAIHSSSVGIYVCGQYYPQKHKLEFTISDAGIGIRNNVRTYLNNPNISSIGAIRWALLEGNSTKQSGQPGGLGLKFLKEFIALNKGKIQIASRLGFYQFCSGIETFEKMSSDFLGTCVNIEINTNDNSSYCLTSEKTSGPIF